MAGVTCPLRIDLAGSRRFDALSDTREAGGDVGRCENLRICCTNWWQVSAPKRWGFFCLHGLYNPVDHKTSLARRTRRLRSGRAQE